MYREFMFEDYETGETFFVEETNENKAIAIAHQYFANPKLIDIMSPDEAEWYGYDTY